MDDSAKPPVPMRFPFSMLVLAAALSVPLLAKVPDLASRWREVDRVRADRTWVPVRLASVR